MTEEEKELERVRNIALDRMRKQNIYGGEGTYLPLGLLESEMDKVRREELDKAKKLEADRAAVLEENRKKTEAMQRVGLLPKIQPDLSAYAMDIFPQLKTMLPPAAEQTSVLPGEPVEKTQAEMPAIQQKTQVVQPKESKPAEQQKPKQEVTPVVEKQPSVEDLMKESEQRESQARFGKSMAQFRDAMIGMGLGKKYESDMEMYDAAIKSANKPLQDLMLKAQLKDEQAKRDPSSPISKFLRSHLNSRGIDTAGLENVSYSQMEKIYPEFIKSMDKKLETEARKEEAVANRIYRQTQAELTRQSKMESEQEKKYKDLATRTSKIISDKDESYNAYVGSKNAEALINSALQNWESSDDEYKTSSSTAFMNFAKLAQGDKSVVRESDMKVLAGGINYGSLGSLVNKFAAKIGGAKFTPQELKAFKAVVQQIREIKKRDMQQRLNPILKKAQESNVSPDLLVDSTLLEDIYTTPLSPEERLNKIESRMKELQDKQKQ